MPYTSDLLSGLEKFVKDASETQKNDVVTMILHYGVMNSYFEVLTNLYNRTPLDTIRYVMVFTTETMEYIGEINVLIQKATEFLPLVINAIQDKALSEFVFPKNLDVSKYKELATPLTIFKPLKQDALLPNIMECVVAVLTNLRLFRLLVEKFLDAFPKEQLLIYLNCIHQLLEIECRYLDFLKSAKIEKLSTIPHYIEELGITVELNSTTLTSFPQNYNSLTNTSVQYIKTKKRQEHFSEMITELSSPDSYLFRHITLVSQFFSFNKKACNIVSNPDEAWQKEVTAQILEAQQAKVPLVTLEIITKSLEYIGRSLQYHERDKHQQMEESCEKTLAFIFNLLAQLDNEEFRKSIAEQWQHRRNTLHLLPASHLCYASSISQINELYLSIGNIDVLLPADYQKYIFKLLDHQLSLLKSYNQIFSKDTVNSFSFPIGIENVMPFSSLEFYNKAKILKLLPINSILDIVTNIKKQLPPPPTTDSKQIQVVPRYFNQILLSYYRDFGDKFIKKNPKQPGATPLFMHTVLQTVDDGEKENVLGPLKDTIERLDNKHMPKEPIPKVKPFNEVDFPAAPAKKLEQKQIKKRKKTKKIIKKTADVRVDKDSKLAMPTPPSPPKTPPEIAEMQKAIDTFKEFRTDYEQAIAIIKRHMQHRDSNIKIDACLKLIDLMTMQFNRLIGKKRNSIRLKKFINNYNEIEQLINEISKELLQFIDMASSVPKEFVAKYQQRLKINEEDYQQAQTEFNRGLERIEQASMEKMQERDKVKAIMGDEWWENHLYYQDEDGNWQQDGISNKAKKRELLENILKSTKELQTTFQMSNQVLENIKEAKQPSPQKLPQTRTASFIDKAYPRMRRYSDSDIRIKMWSPLRASKSFFHGNEESKFTNINPDKDHLNPRVITPETQALVQRARTSYYILTTENEFATPIPAPLPPLPKDSSQTPNLLSKLQELIPDITWQMIKVSSEAVHYGFEVTDENHVDTLKKIFEGHSSPITIETIERDSQQIAILSHVNLKSLGELSHVARDKLQNLTEVGEENHICMSK